jgi:nitrite reductase/ring-hydroxylating ferredoxin subunit
MKILRFQRDHANLIEYGDRSYFLHRDRAGAYVLIRARCPHRGGPLFLGTVQDGPAESIRCPWHDSVVTVKAMQKRAPPMVMNGSECRVIIGDVAEEGHVRCVRTLLNESASEAPHHASGV